MHLNADDREKRDAGAGDQDDSEMETQTHDAVNHQEEHQPADDVEGRRHRGRGDEICDRPVR